jgi:hypothetical protein
MAMRISGRGSLLVAVLGASACGYACSSGFDGCDDSRSCEGSSTAGSAGSDGKGGASGNGGTSSGATGGSGGDAGQGAAPGGTSNTGGDGGTGEAGDAGAGGAPESGTPVNGLLKHQFGYPHVGWTVKIGDKEAVTDASGEFTITGVGETYDLLIAPTGDHLRLYQGLTTREPVVAMPTIQDDPGRQLNDASVSGTVSNILAGDVGMKAWFGDYYLANGLALTSAPAGTWDFSLPISWFFAEDPTQVELFAANSDGTLWRTGSAMLNVSDSNAYTNVGVALTDRATHTVSVDVLNNAGIEEFAVYVCVVTSLCEPIAFTDLPIDVQVPSGLPLTRHALVQAGSLDFTLGCTGQGA